MIYLNFGHNKTDKKIKFQNLHFEYSRNNKDIQVFYDDLKLVILDGFFFDLETTCKEFGCKPSNNHAEIIFNLQEKDIENFITNVDGFFNLFLVNLKRGTIKAYSDHVGSKTIFFTYLKNDLFLSDDIKYLLNKSDKQQLNKKKVTEYFSLMKNFGGDTFCEEFYEIRQSVLIFKECFSKKRIF